MLDTKTEPKASGSQENTQITKVHSESRSQEGKHVRHETHSEQQGVRLPGGRTKDEGSYRAFGR